MKRILIAGVLLLALSLNAQADFSRGVAAYKRADYNAAINIFHKLAAEGDHRAQFAMGLVYDRGHGVPQDKSKAFKWYEKGASSGNAKAQYNLALMYQNAEGVPRDEPEAIRWYLKAAERGISDAIERVHELAEGGNAEVQYQFANLYRKGNILPQTRTKPYDGIELLGNRDMPVPSIIWL